MSAADYDALVIGAGLSGLAAGIRLAHFDRRVLVLDRHTRVGGLNSWYARGGREHSVGLHAMTHVPPAGHERRAGGALARLLRQLRIKRDELRLAPQRGSSIRFPSATLRFDDDPETLAGEVARAFPGAVDDFRRLDAAIRDTDETVTDGHVPQSARARVRAFIRDPLLADMLMAPPMFYGAPTPGDMDWTAFCVLWKGLFQTGLAIPEHGMRPVLDRLVERLREAGGALRLGVGVDALAVDGNGAAIRARLSDGTEITARQVFSSIGWARTEALSAEAPPPGSPAYPPITIVEVLAALPAAPSACGWPDATTFYSFTDRFDFGPPADGLWRTDNGVVAAPENFALASPPDGGRLRLSALADFAGWRALLKDGASGAREAYAAAKARAAADLLAAARRLGLSPDAVAAATVEDVFTPLTLARYTGHPGGSLYGGPEKTRTGRTRHANLFVIGADQGFHGIVGAMLSGVTIANRYGLNRNE